jgi:hypothetical protein
MTSTIITKNSSTASSVPSSGSLTQGELAVNVTDKKLYTKDSGGTVVKLVGSLGNQEANAAAITGGSINGTTVGASTASTGAFTTLSASSTVSGTGFSTYLASPPAIGGTAAAAGAFTTLSASGAVTLSGGTANGVAYLNGSKVVTSGSALTFDGTTLVSGTGIRANSYMEIRSNTSTLYWENAANTLYWAQKLTGSDFAWDYFNGTSNAEQMRLTSTGLGIGTSSPSYKLHVNGYVYSGSGFVLLSQASGGGNIFEASGNTGINIGTTSNTLEFATSGSTRMRLDSSGNLGLGVTPSAWNSSFRTMQLGNSGYLFGRASQTQMEMGNNAVFDATDTRWEYITTNTAQRYLQDGSSGSHQWFNAPSGTAGNAITFTQAMTLTAAGRLGIGQTAPGVAFSVAGASEVWQIAFAYANSGTGALIGSPASDVIAFGNWAGSERARIDSSGNLLVGTTSVINSGKISISAALYTASTGISIQNTQTTYGSSTNFALFLNSGGATAGNIYQSAGTTVNYNTSSDARLKENIGVATDTSVIDNTVIHDFIWKADSRVDRGVFAQEAYEVKPSAVGIGKDDLTESGELAHPWSVDYSKYVPDLIVHAQQLKKQVQEQQAIIVSLQARLDAANL